MYCKLLQADRTALAQALRDIWDTATAAGPCTLRFYTGAPPAGGPSAAVTTQTLLGTVTCSDPIGTVAGGVLTFGTISQDDAADASGTAAWARLIDADGNGRGDFDVTDSAPGSTGVIKLNTVTIVKDGPIRVTSFVVTMPGA